jgi:hypothetical protein
VLKKFLDRQNILEVDPLNLKRPYPGTCVAPDACFVHGIHKPTYKAYNFRQTNYRATLGRDTEQQAVGNEKNFPQHDVEATASSWVYEIPNSFPFMGATFIPKGSADKRADGCNPFRQLLQRRAYELQESSDANTDLKGQSRQALLAVARTTRDPNVLTRLAERSCRFTYDGNGAVFGLVYEKTSSGQVRPAILDAHLFELVSNNPSLPDHYKRCMVLMPGVQGDSPVVGEYAHDQTHVWEYLRENSYIPWGHYAANMAHDAVRYAAGSLTLKDIEGLRHLYYQRIYTQLAAGLGVAVAQRRRPLSAKELEELRRLLLAAIEKSRGNDRSFPFNGNIWGQNLGFDLSPSGYRLNASHQQIHQQYALVPASMPAFQGGEDVSDSLTLSTFVLGDLVAGFTRDYCERTGKKFFSTYLQAIIHNQRMDGGTDRPDSLIIYADEHVLVFVPKAQRSQGEIQLMTKQTGCGNVIEADASVRASLDRCVLMVLKILESLGAEMITAFEVSKRFDNPESDQRLLYCFLPRHPQSPGSFTEFQQRWIIGHYPEDFAQTCRQALAGLDSD